MVSEFSSRRWLSRVRTLRYRNGQCEERAWRRHVEAEGRSTYHPRYINLRSVSYDSEKGRAVHRSLFNRGTLWPNWSHQYVQWWCALLLSASTYLLRALTCSFKMQCFIWGGGHLPPSPLARVSPPLEIRLTFFSRGNWMQWTQNWNSTQGIYSIR